MYESAIRVRLGDVVFDGAFLADALEHRVQQRIGFFFGKAPDFVLEIIFEGEQAHILERFVAVAACDLLHDGHVDGILKILGAYLDALYQSTNLLFECGLERIEPHPFGERVRIFIYHGFHHAMHQNVPIGLF